MKTLNMAFIALTSTAFLAGCNTTSSPRVVLPSTPPLSAEVLEQTAGSCQKEIERIESRSPYVPKERKKEFETVLDLAHKNCDEMSETLGRLKAATHQEQSFRQNVQHAESTMLPGTIVAEPNTQYHDTSLQTGGEISAEPLR